MANSKGKGNEAKHNEVVKIEDDKHPEGVESQTNEPGSVPGYQYSSKTLAQTINALAGIYDPPGYVTGITTNLLKSLSSSVNPVSLIELNNLLGAVTIGGITTQIAGIPSLKINSDDKKAAIDFEVEKHERYQKLWADYRSLQGEKDQGEEAISDLKSQIEQLQKENEIDNIRARVRLDAGALLIRDQSFRDKFQHARNVNSAVVSIDIRRSTELMLKARTPQLYADFIISLTRDLASIVTQNFGVFDKFTGDGVLAFFPEFYTGRDCMIHALRAAKQCHECFKAHYDRHRNAFNVFIKDIGLGIGIDYGEVTLVNQLSELTVVGIPVVYACRFSGTDAGTTALNVSAFEELKKRHKNFFKFVEREIAIKHEGIALVYEVDVMESAITNIEIPEWYVTLGVTGSEGTTTADSDTA